MIDSRVVPNFKTVTSIWFANGVGSVPQFQLFFGNFGSGLFEPLLPHCCFEKQALVVTHEIRVASYLSNLYSFLSEKGLHGFYREKYWKLFKLSDFHYFSYSNL